MTTTVRSETDQDAQDIIANEITRTRSARKPTSRHRLAEIISERTGMPFRDALDVVGAFCDKNAPGVPEYMGSEFGIFWLKVIAVVNAIVGVGCFYSSAQMYHQSRPMWPLLSIGTVFCGIAAFFWVKSLEHEVDRRKKHKDE